MDGRARRLHPRRSGARTQQYAAHRDTDAHTVSQPDTDHGSHHGWAVAHHVAGVEPQRIGAGEYTDRNVIAGGGHGAERARR